MPQNQQFYDTFIKLEFSNILRVKCLTLFIDWDMVVNICSRNSKNLKPLPFFLLFTKLIELLKIYDT